MKTICLCIIAFSALFITQTANAQLDIPRPSPLGRVYQKVGLNDVTIEYSRPSAKGRVIFGDLVPFGKLWRTGANAATKLTLADTATIEGQKIPKGEYSLLTIPGKDEWTIIINKDAQASFDKYDQAKDQARFTVKPKAVADKVETFTINISDVGMDNATVELIWESTKVAFKITTEVDAKVMKQINEAMKGIAPMTYYRAAVYYYDSGKDLNQALTWVNEALKGMETFWMLHQKAKIQAKMGDYKSAITTAEKSKELAIKEKNDDYIALNDKAIAEWKKM